MTLVLDIVGQPLTVAFDTIDAEELARTLLSDLMVDSPPGEVSIRAKGADAGSLLVSLVGSVNLAVVHYGVGRLMPHAAAVAHPDGSVALLCGGSGSGKSTLTAALLRRGCAYLTDETSVVEPDSLELLPFRKPLSLKAGSHSLYPELRPSWAGEDDVWLVPASAVADVPRPAASLEVRVLIFPRYDPGVAGTEVRLSTPGEAAYLVGSQSSRLRNVAGGPLPALARLARRTQAYHLHYSDSTLAADEVLHLWPK